MYKEGDFSFISHKLTRACYEDAWTTIHKVNGAIEYLKNKNINKPWMFINDAEANNIMNELSMYHFHSGASLSLTMRQMETIVKYGWDTYVESEIKTKNV